MEGSKKRNTKIMAFVMFAKNMTWWKDVVLPEEKRNMHKGTDKSSSMAGVYIRQLTLCGTMLERERERALQMRREIFSLVWYTHTQSHDLESLGVILENRLHSRQVESYWMTALTMDYNNEIYSILYKKKIAREFREYVGVDWHWRLRAQSVFCSET